MPPPPSSLQGLFLLLLSLAAGCVDAIAFVQASVFPANMTGNSVVFAVALLQPKQGSAWLCALVLIGFIIGAAAAAKLVHGSPHEWSRRVTIALLSAGIILLGCVAVIAVSGAHYTSALVVASSVAMGLQSAAVQHLNVAGVATAFVTGTLTTAVTRFVGLATLPSSPPPPSPWLPTGSWLAYFLGAFIGGLQSFLHTPIPMLVPGLLITGVALAGWKSLRPWP